METVKKISREERFAREYCIDLNGKKAAIRAGYSRKTAEATASRLLKKDKVSGLIAKINEKVCSKLEVTVERVIREIALLAFSNMLDYIRVDGGGQAAIDLSSLSRDQAAAIQEITSDTTGGTGDGIRLLVLRTKVKLASKGDALELLGRHLKLFTDKIEHSGLDGLADKLNRIRMRKMEKVA